MKSYVYIDDHFVGLPIGFYHDHFHTLDKTGVIPLEIYSRPW